MEEREVTVLLLVEGRWDNCKGRVDQIAGTLLRRPARICIARARMVTVVEAAQWRG